MKKGDIYIYRGSVLITGGKLGHNFENEKDGEDFSIEKKTKDNRFYVIGAKFIIDEIDDKGFFSLSNVKDKEGNLEMTHHKQKIEDYRLKSELNELEYQKRKKQKATKTKLEKDNKLENLTLKEIREKYGGNYFINEAIIDYIRLYLQK